MHFARAAQASAVGAAPFSLVVFGSAAAGNAQSVYTPMDTNNTTTVQGTIDNVDCGTPSLSGRVRWSTRLWSKTSRSPLKSMC